ncbi:MAG: hypothetical protein NTX50_07340 [Candidatus Sumerlaeota bacterium]|nr:hypothetical protein [Candidatus Sumerlaeota bacterium]
MLLKNGTIIIDRGLNERRFPEADYQRWKKEYEKTLTPEERKKAAEARALLKKTRQKDAASSHKHSVAGHGITQD